MFISCILFILFNCVSVNSIKGYLPLHSTMCETLRELFGGQSKIFIGRRPKLLINFPNLAAIGMIETKMGPVGLINKYRKKYAAAYKNGLLSHYFCFILKRCICSFSTQNVIVQLAIFATRNEVK